MKSGQQVRMKHSGTSTDRQVFTFVGVEAHNAQTATLLREDGKTIPVDVASIEPIVTDDERIWASPEFGRGD